MTALYIIGILIGLLLFGFLWYYIKEFARNIYHQGCGFGCGATLILVLVLMGLFAYLLTII